MRAQDIESRRFVVFEVGFNAAKALAVEGKSLEGSWLLNVKRVGDKMTERRRVEVQSKRRMSLALSQSL
ncbi:hypothetical protein, partial [Leptolyngbya sp. BC1307]|uniref:hypothetical protein n=1 Tax=Leptolyngbya sp. BC1307 TaxID=2029589 RepID=UPI0019823AB3